MKGRILMKKRVFISLFLVFILVGTLVVSANSKKESINVLLYGLDGREEDEYERSDSIMIINYNFNSNKAIITSIPRDSYVRVTCRNNRFDKINHAYVYGELDKKGDGQKCLNDTVSKLFEVNNLYNAQVDFDKVIEIIDYIGLISITPSNSFCQSNIKGTRKYCFEANKTISMDGEQSLAYMRNRKSLPNGDLDRSKNQRQVLKEVINKVLKLNLIGKIKTFNFIKNRVETDINMNDLNLNALASMNNITMEEYTLKGKGVLKDLYYYELDPENLAKIKKCKFEIVKYKTWCYNVIAWFLSQAGKASDCNSLIAGSNPVGTSTFFKKC